jgi:hypothetical protein
MADRLAWSDGQLHVGEVMITTQNSVSIYDGSEKVREDFKGNFVILFIDIYRQIIKKV